MLERELAIMDILIRSSGIEELFVEMSMKRYVERSRSDGLPICATAMERHQRNSCIALRCMVLKQLLGESYRKLSMHLAQSALMQRFCGIDNFDEVRVPGKSRLQEYAQWLEPDEMTAVLNQLKEAASQTDTDGNCPAGLNNALELDVVWVDSTALKARIHFPTDWVLLRDAARTLLKAVALIRKHGLKYRMEEPGAFLSRMNSLCIAMSAARRRLGSKKQRKKVLRTMKKLLKVIEGHARRYHEILDLNWEQTDWTRLQAESVLKRIAGVLEQLPQAVKQAHERIIGERQVESKDKILSLYEADIHVIVRGKADSEVEFGNSLFLAEQRNGFIVDHELVKQVSPGDSELLARRLDKLSPQGDPTKLAAIFADRGFMSKRNSKMLEANEIFDGLCPRDPVKFREKMKDDVFAGGQMRRGQTEARISILKNVFLDQGKPRAKGFSNREAAVKWAVLAHNLRVLARMCLEEAASLEIAGRQAA